MRITARLTEARSGQEIWSERFDRELGDVFALQDEVVGGVVAELRRALGAGIEHTPRERTVRPEVWALLVQGRAQMHRHTLESGPASRELLLRCVTLDPEFALGWAELAPNSCTSWDWRTTRISNVASSTFGTRSSWIPKSRSRT